MSAGPNGYIFLTQTKVRIRNLNGKKRFHTMRGLSLERRILLLVLLPLLGGLIPGVLMVIRAQRELQEMRHLTALADVVWKLSELDSRIDSESTNWYFFKSTFEATDDERKKERVKQDQWRIESSKTITSYKLLRSEIDSSSLSAPLRNALDTVDRDIAALPELRQLVDHQVDDGSSITIMEDYRGFRRDINAVSDCNGSPIRRTMTLCVMSVTVLRATRPSRNSTSPVPSPSSASPGIGLP